MTSRAATETDARTGVVRLIRRGRGGVALTLGVVVLTLSASPAAGGTGRAAVVRRSAAASPILWAALGGKLVCGIGAHAPGTAEQLLCADRVLPAPKGPFVDGDPGFVYLAARGRPHLARLSQYSWEQPDGWDGSHRTTLKPGQTWRHGTLGVTCSIRQVSVRCTNRSHHGFTITRRSYRAF